MVALSVAADVYRAILNVSAAVEARITPTPKLWMPSRISTLNDVGNTSSTNKSNKKYQTIKNNSHFHLLKPNNLFELIIFVSVKM